MWSQLARLKFCFIHSGKRTIMDATHFVPMEVLTNAAKEEIKQLDPSNKHWVCKGRRSLAIAIQLLQQNKIIAIPTDTVYGLAGIANEANSIQKLYKIKGRSENKPLSISIDSVENISKWGVIDHLPVNLLPLILPGPYTIVLKRTPALNPLLNPGIDTVGIRIPQFSFLTNISKIVGPLALTSANISNEPSCLYALEFEKLWSQLGGIFYSLSKNEEERLRKGSTIVDLSYPNHFKIVRSGVAKKNLIRILRFFGLQSHNSN